METTKTIQTLAKEIYNNMKYKERTNGKKYCCLKNDIEWQRDIIRESHLGRMPSDDVYDRINTILGVIYELDEEANEDDIREAIYQIEPDCYTSNLTAWLHSDNRNVYYLDEALEMGCTDGFALLACAQKAYIEEIANNLVNAIQEYIEAPA